MEFLAKHEEILRLVPAYRLHSLRMTGMGFFTRFKCHRLVVLETVLRRC